MASGDGVWADAAPSEKRSMLPMMSGRLNMCWLLRQKMKCTLGRRLELLDPLSHENTVVHEMGYPAPGQGPIRGSLERFANMPAFWATNSPLSRRQTKRMNPSRH